LRYDDATNILERGRCRDFGRNYSKKNFIRKIYSERGAQNSIYGRELLLSMWIGLFWLRVLGSQVI
jgi:hypothetical protein